MIQINYQDILQEIEEEIQPLFKKGQVANYIPALAKINPKQFAMSIKLLDGTTYNIGNTNTKFSIQSISKVFTFTLALELYGRSLYKRVGHEPSGDPFNSLVQLEHEEGIPRNPFINAGAIVVCDSLISKANGDGNALADTLAFIHSVSADSSVDINMSVADSEMQHGFRNASLAHLMKSFGNLNNDVETVLETYFQQCSVEMTPLQLSRAFLYLANSGTDPITNKQYLTPEQAKRVNALMLTCGHYDASGDFAFRVGLPGKSGVGGGIVAIIPGKMAIAVYSPGLNEFGNSLVGTKALELFTSLTGLSIF